jgi:hypothetical protein
MASQLASRLQNRAKLDLARSVIGPELRIFTKESPSQNQTQLFFSFHNHSTPPLTMASRTFSRALRSPLAKQLSAPARRTFVSALNASARPTAARTVVAAQQVRGVKTIDFAGTKEDVYGEFQELSLENFANNPPERADWPAAKLQVFSLTAISMNMLMLD